MPRTAQQIVDAEVLTCISLLIYEISNQAADHTAELQEAAFQAGWREASQEERKACLGERDLRDYWWMSERGAAFIGTAEELCKTYDIDIDDSQRDVFEHWAVTDWMADKLIEKGETVDKDFYGLCVWARTTTGQSMVIDGVIEEIAKDTAA